MDYETGKRLDDILNNQALMFEAIKEIMKEMNKKVEGGKQNGKESKS